MELFIKAEMTLLFVYAKFRMIYFKMIFKQFFKQGFHRPWKVLELENYPGKSCDLLIIGKILKKSWNFTQYCLMNFLFQVVYNEFLSGCYVRFPQIFSLFIGLFLELKYKKCCNSLSHNYFLFTFDSFSKFGRN